MPSHPSNSTDSASPAQRGGVSLRQISPAGRRARQRIAIVCFAVFGAFDSATAQAPRDPVPSPAPAQPVVREAPLGPVIYQEADGGRGFFLPGVTVESYRELQRRIQDQAPPPPPYSIERIELEGAAPVTDAGTAGVLPLKVKFQIRLTGTSRLVRVPIGMRRMVLRSPAGKLRYDGKGTARLEYSDTQQQFVCVLEGAADSFHEVEFDMACAIQPDRLGQQIAIALPSAPTLARLTVPFTPLEGSVAKGNYLLNSSARGNQTAFTLEGQGEELQFTWRRGVRPTVNTGPSLTAQAKIDVRIQSQLDVRASCSLLVTSVGAPLQSFDVRLPPGMKLTTESRQAGLNIRSLSGDELPSTGETVRVTLDEPSDGPTRVELTATLAQGGAAGRFEALGFEVLDAFQRGTILVSTSKGWTALPIDTEGVNRISPPPDAPLGTWQFAFENRSRSLTVQVSPAKSRLHMQPVYAVHVVRGQLSLRAQFRCSLGGADVGGSLNLALSGWTVRNITSDRLVDLESVDLSSVEPLQIPLTRADDLNREFSVTIEAAKPMGDEAEQFSFRFPEISPPINTTVTMSAAKLIVTSADDIELSPKIDELRGLAAAYGTPANLLDLAPAADLQQSPLVYNDLVGDEVPAFSAGLTYHTQTISADLLSTVSISAAEVGVRQQITHRIAYVPVRHLLLDAPMEILEPNARLSVTLDGEPLNVAPVDQPSLRGRAVLRVELPDLTIGDCELDVVYRMPDPDFEGGEFKASLVLPVVPDGLSTHQLDLKVDESLQSDAALDPAWMPDPGAADGSHYIAQGAGQSATIQLRDRQVVHAGASTLVLRTWVQSWLQENLRRDRVAFHVRTDFAAVQIQLPGELVGNTTLLNAAVDGRRALHQFDSETNRVSIPLPKDNDEHVVEIWYSLLPPSSDSWLVSPVLDSPSVADAIELGQSFWQILVPDGQQLVSLPRDVTADMKWRWESGIWQQLSSMDTMALESWVGASSQEPLPAGLKAYSFTTSGKLPPITLSLMRLNRLILMLTLGVMLIVWACLYWPALRSSFALTAWACLVVAVGVVYPSLAFGVAQAVVLAVALVALGQLLRQSLVPVVNVASESVSEAITRKAPVIAPHESPSHGTTASAFPLSAEAKS